MRKRLVSLLVAVAAVALAMSGLFLNVQTLRAASLSTYTGPGGTNPVDPPNLVAPLNALINNINSDVAPAGTGTPSASIGFTSVNTSTMGLAGQQNGIVMIQLQTTSLQTTTTSTGGAGGCRITGASGCVYILDPNGNRLAIPYN